MVKKAIVAQMLPKFEAYPEQRMGDRRARPGAGAVSPVPASIGASAARNYIGHDQTGALQSAGTLAWTRDTAIQASGALKLDALANELITAEVKAGSVAVAAGGTAGLAAAGAGISAVNKIANQVQASIAGAGASGIHANGLSLARRLAERLPQGYLTEVAPGLGYGEALLAPTVLYSPVTEALWAAGVRVRYAANITGHGWRKLLRHPKPFTYRIHTVPPVPPVLRFIQQQAGHDDAEAYGTLNMGAGFALFLPAADAERAVAVAQRCGVPAWVSGQVESGAKRLLIEPLGVEYSGDALQLR